jgi:hypothetical protein
VNKKPQIKKSKIIRLKNDDFTTLQTAGILPNLGWKFNKAKLSNSKAGTCAVIIYLTSTVADDIIDCAMLNTNLDLIVSYVDVVDELRDSGISEFERAENDLFEYI